MESFCTRYRAVSRTNILVCPFCVSFWGIGQAGLPVLQNKKARDNPDLLSLIRWLLLTRRVAEAACFRAEVRAPSSSEGLPLKASEYLAPELLVACQASDRV